MALPVFISNIYIQWITHRHRGVKSGICDYPPRPSAISPRSTSPAGIRSLSSSTPEQNSRPCYSPGELSDLVSYVTVSLSAFYLAHACSNQFESTFRTRPNDRSRPRPACSSPSPKHPTALTAPRPFTVSWGPTSSINTSILLPSASIFTPFIHCAASTATTAALAVLRHPAATAATTTPTPGSVSWCH